MIQNKAQKETQHAIVWPAAYLRGTTDNYVSNEITVAGLTALKAWTQLNDTTAWPAYYANASDIVFHDGSGPLLSPGARVRILTQETQNGQPARELAAARPNPMLNAHQDWIDGLAGAATRTKAAATLQTN